MIFTFYHDAKSSCLYVKIAKDNVKVLRESISVLVEQNMNGLFGKHGRKATG